VHSRHNRINLNNLNRTNKRGSVPIDTIVATEGIISYVEGCKILSFEEIVFSDHRSYVIDVNLEEYFEDTFSL